MSKYDNYNQIRKMTVREWTNHPSKEKAGGHSTEKCLEIIQDILGSEESLGYINSLVENVIRDTVEGDKIKTLYFEGSCKGYSEEISFIGNVVGEFKMPATCGGYDTTANGYGSYFVKSAAGVGDIIKEGGNSYKVLWNLYSGGDARSFSKYYIGLLKVV